MCNLFSLVHNSEIWLSDMQKKIYRVVVHFEDRPSKQNIKIIFLLNFGAQTALMSRIIIKKLDSNLKVYLGNWKNT